MFLKYIIVRFARVTKCFERFEFFRSSRFYYMNNMQSGTVKTKALSFILEGRGQIF